MSNASFDVVVAGHICLDLLPELRGPQTQPGNLFVPGRLASIGPAQVALGGAVANTGLALHKLGLKTTLMGKIGGDLFGDMILALLRRHDSVLAEHMVVASDEHSSYSFVLSRPGVDRSFLHYTGTNDTLAVEDLSLDVISEARLFHFGYPPLMGRCYSDSAGFAEFFAAVRTRGQLTSLDMSMPDRESPAGKVIWRDWLKCVLPYTDVFVPSFDETLWMLDADRYDELQRRSGGENLAKFASANLLDELASELLEFGAAIVALKLGDQGMYLRSKDAPLRLGDRASWQEFAWAPWANRELLAACFEVESAGTTGAGDCTVAGLLAALLRGKGPEGAMLEATAVGACCVERSDASSGVPSRDEMERRIAAGWRHRTPDLDMQEWRCSHELDVWHGPHDVPANPMVS